MEIREIRKVRTAPSKFDLGWNPVSVSEPGDGAHSAHLTSDEYRLEACATINNRPSLPPGEREKARKVHRLKTCATFDER